MRLEQEAKVIDLVHKYRQHLVEKGAALVSKDRRTQAALRMAQNSATAIFKQLLEAL